MSRIQSNHLSPPSTLQAAVTVRPSTVQAQSPRFTLSTAMAWALSETRLNKLSWDHRRKHLASGRSKVRFRAQLKDDSILELIGEVPGQDDTQVPTTLHRWEIRLKQHATDNGCVLDGQQLQLTADAHGHLIAQLFQAVFASIGEGYAHLLPRLEGLYKAFQAEEVPATVTVVPPSIANPMAGSGTIIQVGSKHHTAYPVLEITRFAGQTQLVFRQQGVTEKIPTQALQHDDVRNMLNQLVDDAFRQKKATTV